MIRTPPIIEIAGRLQFLLSPQQKTKKPTPPANRPTGRALANARLLVAAAEGDLLELRLALEAGSDVNAARDKEQKRTALMLAIRGDDSTDALATNRREMESAWRREAERVGEAMAGAVPPMVMMLLRAGSQVNLSDASGLTALHYAAGTGNAGTCEELLRRKANVNAANPDGISPLVVAVVLHDPALVDLLLRSGADPKSSRSAGRLPLLILSLTREAPEKSGQSDTADSFRSAMAAMMGGGSEDVLREEVVERLLKAGLDPNEAGEEGWTALYLAAEVGSPRIVRHLISKGAKVDAALVNGSTPLALAAFSGRADNVRVLLEAGANPNAVDKEGDTVLMSAAEKGGYAAVELLLRAGAKPGERNKKGQTARDIAVKLRHTALLRLFDAPVAPR
ncbi:MAG: ankyrin repeat domain-containing protein [Armatimonadetes bacterium]|nr:ankyrin repeat domain-containing protein [Armatimonadota bacterium]